MNSKHAPAYCPGPWSADLSPTDDGNVYVYPTRDGEHSDERADICTVLGWGGDDERNANAALIAAAPTMLEALKRVSKDCDALNAEEIRSIIAPVIDRAEGK